MSRPDTAPLAHAAPAPGLPLIFERLEAAYGREHWHWYPEHVRSPLDIIAGAILVQHTTWQSAERALGQLCDAGLLDVDALAVAPDDVLVPLIRTSGTPSVKARRLRALASTIVEGGGLDAFLGRADDDLRARLLATHGVGPETADAIALYAAGRRVFVIDAYTRRLFRRIGIGPASNGYGDWQRWFEQSQPEADARTFQCKHAHIVLHCKAICRTVPRCGACVLGDVCATGRAGDAASPR